VFIPFQVGIFGKNNSFSKKSTFGFGMDSARKAAASSSTPQTSKGADLLLGLMERSDGLDTRGTPVAEFKTIPLQVYADADPVESCHCRKSRCLKL